MGNEDLYKSALADYLESCIVNTIKESIELSKYANEVSSSTQKYIAIDLKNPTKGLEELEMKIQARARLRIKNLRLENNKSQKEIAEYKK